MPLSFLPTLEHHCVLPGAVLCDSSRPKSETAKRNKSRTSQNNVPLSRAKTTKPQKIPRKLGSREGPQQSALGRTSLNSALASSGLLLQTTAKRDNARNSKKYAHMSQNALERAGFTGVEDYCVYGCGSGQPAAASPNRASAQHMIRAETFQIGRGDTPRGRVATPRIVRAFGASGPFYRPLLIADSRPSLDERGTQLHPTRHRPRLLLPSLVCCSTLASPPPPSLSDQRRKTGFARESSGYPDTPAPRGPGLDLIGDIFFFSQKL